MFEAISFQLIALVGIVGTVGIIALHYIIFGPHRLDVDKAQAKRADVRRFSIIERLIHITNLLSFITLGVTGMIAAIGYGSRLTGWLWVIHAFAAPVFALGLTCIIVMWARDACFATYDREWMKYVGGYLGFGKNRRLPADRFNAGQKALLWIIAALGLAALLSGIGRMFPVFGPVGHELLYQVHRYSALLLIMAVLGHAYLGTFANPGTVRAMILGRVSPAWAEHHHSVWWESLNKERDR